MVFATMPRAMHKGLIAAGAVYHIWSGSLEGRDPSAPVTARFVCDWSLPAEEIDRFLEIARNAALTADTRRRAATTCPGDGLAMIRRVYSVPERCLSR